MSKIVLRRQERHYEPVADRSAAFSRLLDECRSRRPPFSKVWVNLALPPDAQVMEEYFVGDAKVRILSLNNGLRHVYHLTPWEYTLDRETVRILNRVMRSVISSPPPENGLSTSELRGHVRRTAIEEIERMARSHAPGLPNDQLRLEGYAMRMSEVVERHTIGLGLLDVLVRDERIEDIFLDAPVEENPIHLTMNGMVGHSNMLKLCSNLVATEEEVSGFVSRMRQSSGRPFSLAFPILETDIEELNARATIIGPPLSPHGTALALRRHASEPWTLTKLAYNGTIDCQTAGLLSFLLDGQSTMLVCGARGSGKSSLLSAIMFEFSPTHRILTIEDTPELPVRRMQTLGYKIQSLLIDRKMDQAVEQTSEEVLRVSLRLGESAIVMGEVRGREAKVLYDGMRTGRAGSSVLGTIHGDSPRSVYERVVHEMGIPKEAFSATDIVINLGLIRPRGSQRPQRKLLELCEYRPSRGHGEFETLVELDRFKNSFNARFDCESEVIGKVAKSWAISYEEALMNIQARTEMRELLLECARTKGTQYLSPEWVCRANFFFWEHCEKGVEYQRTVEEFRSTLQGGG